MDNQRMRDGTSKVIRFSRNQLIAAKQKALDYEYLKTRVYDLEQKNILLDKELKDLKTAVNIMWNSVQRLSAIKAETIILPDDFDESAPDTFIGTKPEE